MFRCANAGKHVLLEKPVAPTLAEGKQIQAAFRQAGKKCFVCFYRRAMNRFMRLKQIIDDGEIGEITGVQIMRSAKALTDPAAWRADPGVCGGDVFTETDIHALDIMEMLMGPVHTFTYAKDRASATYSLSVKFVSGKVAGGVWNYNSQVESDRFTILGTGGRIELDFFHNDQPLFIWNGNGCREEVITDSRHVGLNMEQAIVNELLGRGSFSGTLDNALETLSIASGVYFG